MIVPELSQLLWVFVQVPQSHGSFIQTADQFHSGGPVSVTTAQADLKEILATEPSVEEDELVNMFRQRCVSDERCAQSRDEIRKPLKEHAMTFFKIVPLLRESATEFLAYCVWHP